MEPYDELKDEMETIQQQIVEARKYERTNALKEAKSLCKEFGLIAGYLRASSLKGGKAIG